VAGTSEVLVKLLASLWDHEYNKQNLNLLNVSKVSGGLKERISKDRNYFFHHFTEDRKFYNIFQTIEKTLGALVTHYFSFFL
jgi:hypothetical protein